MPMWSVLSNNVHVTGPQGRGQCSLVSSSYRFLGLTPLPHPTPHRHTLWPLIFSHWDDVNENCVSKWCREPAFLCWSEQAPAHHWIYPLQSKTRSSPIVWEPQEKGPDGLEIHQCANYIKDFKRFLTCRKWRWLSRLLRLASLSSFSGRANSEALWSLILISEK